MLVTGSLACTNFSTLMNLNWSRMKPEETERRPQEARQHLDVYTQVRKLQRESGRYLLHDYLLCSFLARIRDDEFGRVHRSSGDKGAFLLIWSGARNQGWPKACEKPTGCLTNSSCIAGELNKHRLDDHDHVTLEGKNRTTQAHIHPPELCRAICKGLKYQKQLDWMGLFILGRSSGLTSARCTGQCKNMGICITTKIGNKFGMMWQESC